MVSSVTDCYHFTTKIFLRMISKNVNSSYEAYACNRGLIFKICVIMLRRLEALVFISKLLSITTPLNTGRNLKDLCILKTRMHSSRMRTARTMTVGGGGEDWEKYTLY